MKFYLLILFHSFVSLTFAFSCTFPHIPFCEIASNPQVKTIVSGVITAIDDDGINFEITHLLRGNETKSNIRIWDGTDFDCNGNFSMAASDLGTINDTLILILPKIDTLINSWDVIGDYRRPNNYGPTSVLQVKKKVVRGFISGLEGAPPEFNLLSFDYAAFIDSWLEIKDCSKIVNTKQIKNRLDVIVFPNPASDFIRLESDENLRAFNIKVFDHLGRVVLSKKKLDSYSEIPIADLPLGIYYLFIEDQEFKPSFVRFVKS